MPTQTSDLVCIDCRWFDPEFGDDVDHGTCRRYPPKVFWDAKKQDWSALSPVVNSDSFCGECDDREED